MHVDTPCKFRDMFEFRDRIARDFGFELIVWINPEGRTASTPSPTAAKPHTQIMKTEALKQALDHYGFDAAFGGARRDEEKSRAKERIFSFRNRFHQWDPKNQRPELWNLYNARVNKGESIRVFPLSNWTELDVWLYIQLEQIPIVPLYFAEERPVVERDGTLIMVDDARLPPAAGRAAADCARCASAPWAATPCTGASSPTPTSMRRSSRRCSWPPPPSARARVIDFDQPRRWRRRRGKATSSMSAHDYRIPDAALIRADIDAYLRQHEEKDLLRFSPAAAWTTASPPSSAACSTTPA